ncbi:MAG TPA: hypothetical protein VK539_31505 [Myxococcaceae bacterium]|nr:hypothetical protein [Myxococcaceae bacterium]
MANGKTGEKQPAAQPIAQSPADLPYAQLVIKLLGQVQVVDGPPVTININNDQGQALISLRGWMVVSLGSETDASQVVAGLCLMTEGRFALIQPGMVRMFDTPGDLYTYGVALSAAGSVERRLWKTACLRFPVLSSCELGPQTVSGPQGT